VTGNARRNWTLKYSLCGVAISTILLLGFSYSIIRPFCNVEDCSVLLLSVCLRFNGHFPGGPGLAGTRMSPFRTLLELRVMEVVVTTRAIRRAKFQSKCRHQQTNTQFFYWPDALPVGQPTMSKHSLYVDSKRCGLI